MGGVPCVACLWCGVALRGVVCLRGVPCVALPCRYHTATKKTITKMVSAMVLTLVGCYSSILSGLSDNQDVSIHDKDSQSLLIRWPFLSGL